MVNLDIKVSLYQFSQQFLPSWKSDVGLRQRHREH